MTVDLVELLAKATPGPWAFVTNQSRTCEFVKAASRPDAKIAEVHSYSNRKPDDAERKANAALIALAPTMASQLLAMKEALEEARDKFLEYEIHHQREAKNRGQYGFVDEERARLEKAKVNRQMADMLSAALNKHSGEGQTNV